MKAEDVAGWLEESAMTCEHMGDVAGLRHANDMRATLGALIAERDALREALKGIEPTAREYVRNWLQSPKVRAPWQAVLDALDRKP